MGFRSEKDQIWKLLIDTLKNPPHLIKLPPRKLSNGEPNRDYDNRQKRLSHLNKKLISFFNKNYSLGLPNNYKLYRKYEPEGYGTYYFIFKRPWPVAMSRFDRMDRETLLKKINMLLEQWHNSKEGDQSDLNANLFLELKEAFSVAKEKGYITEEETEELLYQEKDTAVREVYREDQTKWDFSAS